MSAPLLPAGSFKVDTHRPRSRSKQRAKIRHMLAVAAGMFPLMALFVWGMSLMQIAELRRNYYTLAVVFLACGMAALLLYSWARSEKLRRREISNRNREMRHRRRWLEQPNGSTAAELAEEE